MSVCGREGVCVSVCGRDGVCVSVKVKWEKGMVMFIQLQSKC